MSESVGAPTDLSNDERICYWASRPPSERIAAGWQMTVAHYKAVGQYLEGQMLNKSFANLRNRREAQEADDW